jgi:hypothetical protein
MRAIAMPTFYQLKGVWPEDHTPFFRDTQSDD